VLYLDHLTVAALSLDEGVAHVRRALGVEIPPGGAHPIMGTHNHLMQLGNSVFLEVIAPDPGVTPQRPRWFGLDDPDMHRRLACSPRLLTWVVRVADIRTALADVPGAAGEPVQVSRGTLSWQISIAPDGSLPSGGAFPTLIEWPDGVLPGLSMPDLGCRLDRLSITHLDGASLAASLKSFFADDRVVISSGAEIELRAAIMTPLGPRELG